MICRTLTGGTYSLLYQLGPHMLWVDALSFCWLQFNVIIISLCWQRGHGKTARSPSYGKDELFLTINMEVIKITCCTFLLYHACLSHGHFIRLLTITTMAYKRKESCVMYIVSAIYLFKSRCLYVEVIDHMINVNFILSLVDIIK